MIFVAEIKFFDYSDKVKAALESVALSTLEEVTGELEAQVKRNTVVKTGQTKNSWKHKVTQDGQKYEGIVGSDYMNAVYEEFGTGEYALEGNGRKGGWFYVDDKGDGHFTHGKRPRRPFWNAYTTLKQSLVRHMQDRFRGGLS